MANKAVFIQRRWKEVVKDISEQHGIDFKSLLQKIPAFASGEPEAAKPHSYHNNNGEHSLQSWNISKVERKVLRAAADAMAEVIFATIHTERMPEETPFEVRVKRIGQIGPI